MASWEHHSKCPAGGGAMRIQREECQLSLLHQKQTLSQFLIITLRGHALLLLDFCCPYRGFLGALAPGKLLALKSPQGCLLMAAGEAFYRSEEHTSELQ